MSTSSISPSALSPIQQRRVEDPHSQDFSPAAHMLPFSARHRSKTVEMNMTSTALPRSKSELAMSSLPALEKLHSSQSEHQLRTSPNTRPSSPSPWREEKASKLARTLLNKSSRLLHKRKSSSKLRTLEWLGDGEDWAERDTRELSKRRKSKHNRVESVEADSQLKHSISEPYNFQHLTHTEPLQAKALQSVSHRDLVSEFSAIRASQAPQRELKGIRAENIYLVASPESQFFESPTTTQGSPVASRSGSACGSPRTIDDGPSLATSKSVDSFTRLTSKSFSSPKPPFSPPPRRSSRKPLSLSKVLIMNTSPTAQESPTIPDFVPGSSQCFPPSPAFRQPFYSPTTLPNESMEQTDIAQAVTTPDDTACMLVTRGLASPPMSLEDVPEEEEASGSKQGMRADYFANKLNHARSFPSPKRFTRQFDELPCLPKSTDGEGMSCDPILPLTSHQTEDIPEVSRRISVAPRSLHDSWEDDIDYCYEHAMEANCDLNWTPVVEQEDEWITARSGGLQIQTSFDGARPDEASAQDKPYFDVPKLEAEGNGSGASSAITVGVATPSDAFPSPNVLAVPRDASGSISFPLSPSLLVPKEYTSRLTHEDSYSHKLTEADSKASLNLYSSGIDTSVRSEYSPRSSGSPSSKDISSDASYTSRPTSISTGIGSRHRKSSSVGSIPELVYSRTGRGQDATIDKLVQQISNTNLSPTSEDLAVEDFEGCAPPVPAKEGQETLDKELPPLPLRLSLRARSNSDSASRLLDMSMPPRLGPDFNGRLRSTSIAAQGAARPRGHRTSYSLFPATTPMRC